MHKVEPVTPASASHPTVDADRSALIHGARSYFDALNLHTRDDADPTIQDSDGLVSYIVGSTIPPPEEIQELYDEIAPVMEGPTSVGTSAVLVLSRDDGEK